MKEKSFNIIIPSIKFEKELLDCLRSLEKINYKNFIVTVVLDEDKEKFFPKLKYQLNKMIVGKINMSKKKKI